MVEYNTVTGRFGDALPEVKQRLNGYLSRYDRIKVGASTNIETRWQRGYVDRGWHKLVALYESRFPGSVRSMEKALIAYARGTNFRVRPSNVLPGGESIREGARLYFVYVAVGFEAE